MRAYWSIGTLSSFRRFGLGIEKARRPHRDGGLPWYHPYSPLPTGNDLSTYGRAKLSDTPAPDNGGYSGRVYLRLRAFDWLLWDLFPRSVAPPHSSSAALSGRHAIEYSSRRGIAMTFHYLTSGRRDVSSRRTILQWVSI
jgi:hypothetical protein